MARAKVFRIFPNSDVEIDPFKVINIEKVYHHNVTFYKLYIHTYIHTYIYNIWPFYRCLIGISMLIIGLVSPNWHPMAYPESPGGEEAIAQAPVPPRSSGPPTVPPGRHDVAGTALFTTQDTLRSLFGMFEWKRT